MLSVSGCAGGMSDLTKKDGSGLTFHDVEKLSLEEEFDLAGVRYERANELLADTQAQINDSPWIWSDGIFGFTTGGAKVSPDQDPSFKNSYYYDLRRTLQLPGATGAKEDLDPAIKYFESQGWNPEEYVYEDVEGGGAENDYEVVAVTEDNHKITYTVQADGYYNVQVESDEYWCNNDSELMRAILYRVPKLEPLPSPDARRYLKPGDYTKFPKWSDPIVNAPED